MFHGEKITRKYQVNNGTETFTKTLKYCVVHGEIDLVSIAGELEWQKLHGTCNRPGKNEPATRNFQTMARAA